MKILANENFPGETVEALRTRGHDVTWIRTSAPGSSDQEVMAQAVAESRILITFDKDFGELVFRSGLSSPSGIVLFRISTASPSHITRIAIKVLESRSDWHGHFSVIEDNRLRMTPLP